MKLYSIIWLLLLVGLCSAQNLKKITLEDIWTKNTFAPVAFESYQFTAKPSQYLELSYKENSNQFSIDIKDVFSKKTVKSLVNSTRLIPKGDSLPLEIENISLNADESKILLQTDSKPIYRYSSLSIFYIFDCKTQRLFQIGNGERISNAEFSPDGKKVAYCKNNNLFYVDFTLSEEEIKVTNSGKKNEIINGSTDWVYEEEFELIKAYFWSPDSKKIAFYTFDESEVKTYSLQMWNGLYPVNNTYKYPKAGEKNASISISVYDSEKATSKQVYDGSKSDSYVPRIMWAGSENVLCVKWMNRKQDTLKIFHTDSTFSSLSHIVTIADSHYVEIDDSQHYLSKNKGFFITSEQSGYRHIYFIDSKTKQQRQITFGDWEVTALHGLNEKKGLLFYSSKEKSSLEEHLYSVDFQGGNKKMLTTFSGINRVSFNSDFSYLTNTNINTNTKAMYLQSAIDGKILKKLGDNTDYQAKLKNYEIGETKFSEFTNTKGKKLNLYRIAPANFDSTKKYPVLMAVYGGPGSQEVLRIMDSRNYLWYQHLAQKGVLIYCLDNTGTGGKGAKFKKATTSQLGKLESEDQIEFARYLSKKQYVDTTKLGIWGWSFGGYLSSLCLLLGNDVFKYAIAVAPVTSWRFYDTIYTERFLKTPQDNAKGYDDYSPLTHANKLKGRYLLVHGTGDDNVHFQNAVEMQQELIKAGKQFESFYYPNKAHGIGGATTRLHLYEMMTRFLLK